MIRAVSNPLKCAYCNLESYDLHRDHVVPRSRGGPDNATNIVMACQACNFAKRDSLASEWLGEKCPPDVLLIESRVNAKLKAIFAKRDYKATAKPQPAEPPEATLFAFHYNTAGGVDFIGDVLSETTDTLRMEVVDAFMATGCGMWQLSGEIRDCPKAECRLFNDRGICLETALRINTDLYRTHRT